MKKSVIGVGVAAVLLAAGVAWWASGASKDPDALVLHGNVDVRQVSLAFEESGRIAVLKAEEGDQVRAGDSLAALDTETLALEAEQAAARVAADQQKLLSLQNGPRPEEVAQGSERLAAAEAEAKRTAADLARLREVSGKTRGRGVSGQEIDRAVSAAKAAAAQAQEARQALQLLRKGSRDEEKAAAEAQLRASEAALALSRHRIVKGELRSPADAVVRARLQEVGDMASPQRPVFELALTTPKWVRVYVDEAALGKVKPGMAAQITTDSAPDRPVAGKVGYISSVAEFTPKSVETEDLRTSLVYEVRVRVDDRAGALRLGQPVTVRLDTGDRR